MSIARITADAYVAIRLPSGTHVVTEIKPHTTVHIGKYGSFQADHIIARPYYKTFEVVDTKHTNARSGTSLRIVRAAELNAEFQDDNEAQIPASEVGKSTTTQLQDGVQYDILSEDGQLVMRTNRSIVDDSRNQALSMDEIEALKETGSGAGKELIAKLLKSHAALDQKSAFALAKYTLRKTKKFAKRFTVLPLDVPLLARWMLKEKDPGRIMELREEVLALIGSWSNVHHTPCGPVLDQHRSTNQGRWLVVDDSAGLLVASLAEKLGILRPSSSAPQDHSRKAHSSVRESNGASIEDSLSVNGEDGADPPPPSSTKFPKHPTSNTIPDNSLTLIHSNSQPNLSLLRYFSFDATNPPSAHPLTHRLRTLSWLQLLHPDQDIGYAEPAAVSPHEISTWKSGRRSNYFRKRRRWARIRATVDHARQGNFDGLIVASVMKPETILHHLVPLLKGGAPVVVYSRHIEPVAELSDYYSTARKSSFIYSLRAAAGDDAPSRHSPDVDKEEGEVDQSSPPTPKPAYAHSPTEDFPVDPRLLLAPTIHAVRARPWQVLPGRTHPLMTGKGGAEGFVFTAIRVLPLDGLIEARGKFSSGRPSRGKKRKVDTEEQDGQSKQVKLVLDGQNGDAAMQTKG